MKHWYAQQTRFLKHRFGDDWKLMAGLLAATSPRLKLRTSWDISLTILEAVQAGRPPVMWGLMKGHRLNVERALVGKKLSGNKVERFCQNLLGNLEVVTIDTWMLKLWKVELTSHSKHSKKYGKLERAFQKWARSKGMKPANAQAMLWNYIRHKNGKKPVSFSTIESGSIPI